ncbi:hypothetical protein [Polaromonas sp. Pch-P]|uniref:hypothetical protein n=2 Tax=unclassified Polaromonas TaxID=2638319 RepID=UPI00129E6003|nr:hypothetical protein [Polaromonas sp. Pch-P]QGJ20150.1 hypothetical protein F7R28_18315 [Polaromonas sp. Pch-P]
MKTLFTRVRNLLVLLLCAAPLLIWAISPSIQGLSVTTVPQLKFAQAQIQRLATNVTPFTQTATSPYSRGAISYSSTQPDVASVNASTGEVTPKKVGETRIVATQQAATPFAAATAEYKVQLTGEVPVFQTWTLGSKTYVAGAAYVIGNDLPAAQSLNSNGAITYRLKDPAMATIATVTTLDNVTTVKPLNTGTIILVAEQAATPQFAAGSTESTLTISALPNTVPAVEFTYGASQTLGSTVSGAAGPVTYRVENTAVATVNGLTIKATGVGTTTLFAMQNGVDVSRGSVTVRIGKPTLSFSSSTLTKTVNDKPFELQAGSVDLATGLSRTASVTYAVTSTTNTNAIKLLGDGKTVWIAQGGTVKFTATQVADANHEAATAELTLNINGQALPWVEVKQQLPGTVLRDQEYTIRVLTNSPERLPLGMFNLDYQQFMETPAYWREVPSSAPSARGPNIEDVYVVTFNNPNNTDIRVQPLLAAPQYWSYPGFIEQPEFQWPLGETSLSRVISGPEISFLDAFPGARNPYVLTYGTSPSLSDSVLPSGFRIDDSTVRTDIAQLEFVTATQTSETYKLVPVGVGEYTLKGSIRDGANKDRQTSTVVKVQPAATTLSALQPLTLATDSRRVEVLPPQSSRPGTATFTYQIAGSGSTIARVVTEAGRYYIEPVGTAGTTTLTITQAATGNYAEGSTSISITVNAGAPPITAFLPNITRTYGEVDVLMPLPTIGFNPDQVVGGTITFSFNDITPSSKGAVASAVVEGDKIRIGILHAGVTT